MKFTDTHSHLYLPEFENDIDDLLRKAKQSGVERIYLPDIDSSTTTRMLELAAKHPQFCFPMTGLHPCSVKENYQHELQHVYGNLKHGGFCAVGEIGLDLYWDKTFFEQQKEAFLLQCHWAVEYNLPVVIHTRNSIDEAIECVESLQKKPTGIFHCFSGNVEQANRIISLGYYLGIGGVLTFKNSGLDRVIQEVSLEHLVLETDAPYLAPVPHRGQRNEPSYLRLVAEKLASVKNSTIDEVSRITTLNANRIFKNEK